jgi:hypothetical protein
MKREPTEIDREAAGLFAPAPGMRAWSRGACGRIIGDCRVTPFDSTATIVFDGGGYSAAAIVYAFDTDDPATVGCMLAQVRAVHGWASAFTGLYGGQWVACTPFVAYPGVTEGAALVAAMREAKR